jgi:tetratricopeptide (TPR) repeat protein
LWGISVSRNELDSKIKSVLSLPHDEEVVDFFKPLQYEGIKGTLILTDKRLMFVEERGFISKSFKAVFSIELTDLSEMQVSTTSANCVKLGSFEFSSSNIEALLRFSNDGIYPQVQRSKGLVEHKGKWMTLEEKLENEQLDKGLVKFKGEWITPKAKFEKEQRAKGLIQFMGRWGSAEQVEGWKKLYFGMASDFANRDPHEFEDFIAELFTKMDYSTERTPLTGDYGADVIAKKGEEVVAIQVKRYKLGNDVGVKDVNQVLGSMHRYKANKAIVVTTSDFTLAVRKLATTAPVELWNHTKLYEMIEHYFFGKSEERSITEDISSKKREIYRWHKTAGALFDIQKYQDAIEAFEWILNLSKDLGELEEVTAETLANKGLCLLKLGKPEEAIRCFDEAIEMNPATASTLQGAKNNKLVAQEMLGKPTVQLQQRESESIANKSHLSAPYFAQSLNLFAKSENLEMTLLHVAENQEFVCPDSCSYFKEQYRPDECRCPKGLFMSQRPVPIEKMICTTVLVKIKNISSQTIHIYKSHFHILDSSRNQYDAPLSYRQALCDELLRTLPPQYKNKDFDLCDDAQAIFLMCFPQLPPETKVIRLKYEGGDFKREKLDIKIAPKDKVEEAQSKKPS